MRYLIAIPCMDTVHSLFMSSLLAMRRPEGTEVGISCSSLIYDSRNTLAAKAINEGFDRVLWLDSDMVFDPDLMERLIADMDMGYGIVSGLYFTRKKPIKPCVYKSVVRLENGQTRVTPYTDYPADTIFEAAGAGMGVMMTSVDAIAATGQDSRPFSPIDGFGEDFSFEIKARAAGYKTYCDSRIKAGHIALTVIDEDWWRGQTNHD